MASRRLIGLKGEKDDSQAEVFKMCRLCLTQSSEDELIDIFENSNDVSITIRIMACAGLEVSVYRLVQISCSNLVCFPIHCI